MPLIEGQIGQALQDLIERNVAALKSNLRWKDIDSEQGHWLLQTVFGLSRPKSYETRKSPHSIAWNWWTPTKCSRVLLSTTMPRPFGS